MASFELKPNEHIFYVSYRDVRKDIDDYVAVAAINEDRAYKIFEAVAVFSELPVVSVSISRAC